MELGSLPILSAMKKQMKFLLADRKVISENIANADTPGYVAKETQAPDFSALVESLDAQEDRARPGAGRTEMLGNKAGHVGGPSGAEVRARESDRYEESLDGNAVELEEEMLKASDNQMNYDMVTQLYRKNLQILRTAMGRGGGGGGR